MMHQARLAVVTGGAASGKSRWAERLALASGLKPVYIATAQAHDAEMAGKIARHRAGRGPDWRLVEAPLALPAALGSVAAGEIALVDCLTMWLSNHLLAEADLDAERFALFGALDRLSAPAIFVTNEVGLSVVPDNRLARRFRQEQGGLNQEMAARADLVVAVMCGLPLALKGRLPEAER